MSIGLSFNSKRRFGVRSANRRKDSTKITPDAVREIRKSTLSHAELGRRFGVSATTICKIRNRETWQFIE